MEKANIKVEHDLGSKKIDLAQTTYGCFIKEEGVQFNNTDTANTVSDRVHNSRGTKANSCPTSVKCEGTREVFEMKDEKIELKKEVDDNKCQDIKNFDQRIIKKENEYMFTKENTENVSSSIGDDHSFSEPWIKCEAVEELKLENDLDMETCEITGMNGKNIINKENDHILKHPTAKHKICIHCNATFSTKRTLDQHLIMKHPDFTAEVSSKIHQCSQCAFRTTKKYCLARHILKHPGAKSGFKLKKCIHCNATFTEKINLDNHIIKKHSDFIASVSSKIHECTHCPYKTTLKDKLSIHMLKHPGAKGSYKVNVCIYCNTTFINKINLDDHIIKKHPEHIASVSSKVLECTYCVFKTTSKVHLARHMGQHPGAEGGCELKTCIHCNSTFKNKINLDDHIIKKHPGHMVSVSSKIHECIYCTYKTAKKSLLTKHMLKHPDIESNCKLSVCIHCNATFTSKTNLDNHIIKKHPEHIASVSSKIHECKYCIYKTASKDRWNRHVSKHSGTETYKLIVCIHCNETFTRKAALDDHIIKKHPDHISSVSSKIHECTYCTYKTTAKQKLDRHMSNHTGRKGSRKLKTTCVHCKTTFKYKRTLDDHIIKKHPEFSAEVPGKIHECTHCPYKTILRGNLAQHMLKHPGAEGGYELKKCIHCNSGFRTKRYLDDHIITEHPDFIADVSSKIHECIYCTYKTTQKTRFDEHLLRHPEAADNFKFSTCIHCYATFRNKQRLDRHIIKKHPDFIAEVSSKIYTCTHCTYKTTGKYNFAQHMLKHPDEESSCELSMCIHCNTTFKTKQSLDNHIIQKHPDFIAEVSNKIHKCTHCTYKTTIKTCFNQHMLKHPESKETFKLNICIHCNAKFKNKQMLDGHIIKKHPECISEVSSKMYACKDCAYKTIFKYNFDQHMLKHLQLDKSAPQPLDA